MKMNYTEAIGVTINAGLLAILYTIFGAFISYVMYHIFDEFDDKWTKRSELYKFTDVTVEIVIIALVAFWSGHYVEKLSPIFPVRKELDTLVDGYISGIFFIFVHFGEKRENLEIRCGFFSHGREDNPNHPLALLSQ
jgi:hypothetical protein